MSRSYLVRRRQTPIVGSQIAVLDSAIVKTVGVCVKTRASRVFVFLVCLVSVSGFHSGCATTPEESVCYGKVGKGKLENGWRLPRSGKNFESYSWLGCCDHRTYVHSRVYRVVLDAYKQLHKSHPDKVFKYGETGFSDGGKFWPHRTHQNGLSVDFMTPVVNRKGESETLLTWPFNTMGYKKGIEFDKKGRYGDQEIDFEMVAVHLLELKKSARKEGLSIERVIFDPKLRPFLWKTKSGRKVRRVLGSKFLKDKNGKPKAAWVRHDDHYHVDFGLKCRKLR